MKPRRTPIDDVSSRGEATRSVKKPSSEVVLSWENYL